MSDTQLDYSVFDKFNFERKPVGISYLLKEPDGIPQMDGKLALCELFARAQNSKPFYVSRENVQCGEQVVGMAGFPPVMHSGQLGPHFGMFKTTAANRRVYEYMPLLEKDTVKCILYAPFDNLPADPDIMVITAETAQAEVILRASTYSTGKMWSSKGTTCLSCAWMYAYPYLSGELNYTISGLGFSMKARQVLPEGLFLITIPFDILPMIIDNLNDMEWNPKWFTLGRDKFVESVINLDQEMLETFGAEYCKKPEDMNM
ncbi:MAG: DUF169 domain-containing protein [Dehalococcoidales bacterium]|nr:DUF169 domain-containing protein [Dehalococcoidales bacterium]